jgi:CRP/FNR family cyclic AMP-dependent transcriptional regulator
MAQKNGRVTFDPQVFLSRIGAGKTTATYRANNIIFSQGDTAESVFYLQTGKAKITVLSENGREAVLALLGPGDFFGEGALNGQSRRMATVTAITECAVMRLEKTEMVRTLHGEPKFADLFIAHLLHRNSRIEEDLVDQLFNSSEKRLARTLLLLANFGKEGKREQVLPRISQETLADMIGTTRSRVSFFMNKFRRLGFVEYSGGAQGDLHVHTSLLNMVLYDGTSNDPPKLSKSEPS